MTAKAIIFGLCLCLIVVCAIALGLALFAKYLLARNERLEVQNDHKTELLCILNNRLDEAQIDYDSLERDYKKLIRKDAEK